MLSKMTPQQRTEWEQRLKGQASQPDCRGTAMRRRPAAIRPMAVLLARVLATACGCSAGRPVLPPVDQVVVEHVYQKLDGADHVAEGPIQLALSLRRSRLLQAVLGVRQPALQAGAAGVWGQWLRHVRFLSGT